MAPRLSQILPDHCRLGYVGRAACPAPATGIVARHHQEVKQLLEDAFAGL
jgi:2-oxoglutarate dehydrogenase complex dehydrogenase (E1) component-like enzyme